MLVKKNERGQKILLPAQIAKIYNVSRPTAGKWAEMGLEGDNGLNVYKINKRIYILDNEANHKELHLLREKGIKYKNRNDYEKIEIDSKFINTLDEVSKSQLIIAFEDCRMPLKFAWQNSPELFGNELETKKDRIKKQKLQLKSFIDLFCNYQESISYKLVAVQTNNIPQIEGISEGLSGYQDEPQLTLVSPAKVKPDLEFNLDLFNKINHLQLDLETASLAPALHNPITTAHQGNLVFLGENLLNKSFDADFTLSNLSKMLTSRDFLVLNVLLDSISLDLLAVDYFDSEKVQERNHRFLNNLGIQKNQYTLENKYNEVIKAHQLLLKWNKEIDMVFGALNFSYREGDTIVLEQLSCFNEADFRTKIAVNGLEIVQSANIPTTNETWYILKKQPIKNSN